MTPDDRPSSRLRALWAEEDCAAVLQMASDVAVNDTQLGSALANLDSVAAAAGNSGAARTTPLHLAAGFGKTAAVRRLLDAGQDAAVRNGVGRTPLHDACLGGHAKTLLALVEHAADAVDAVDKDGRTPTHLAAYHGELDCLAILADAGADLRAQDAEGCQPCHAAAQRNHAGVLAFLFDRGVDFGVVCRAGRLPAHYAARYGALDALARLTRHEADLSRGDEMGNLPLHLAARHGHLDCVRFLVKTKVPITSSRRDGKLPTHVSAQHGANGCLHWLLEKGADPNARDADGNAPAHLACENDNAECLNCLLNHDAFPHAKNRKGEIPMDAARRAGHPLRMRLAVDDDIKCPFCVQKFKRLEWEKANQPTHVEAALIRTRNSIYNNPVPSEGGKKGGGDRGDEGAEEEGRPGSEKRDLTAKYYGEHF